MPSMSRGHFRQSPDLDPNGYRVLNMSNSLMQKEQVRRGVDNMLDDRFHKDAKGEQPSRPRSPDWK